METATGPAALFNLGNTLLEQGKVAPAIAAFERCLVSLPNHAGLRYNLANALIMAGRPVEAVDAFLACLRLASDFGAAYVNLANTLRQLAMLEQAQAMAELGVLYLPDVPEAKIGLANVLHDRGEYAAAASLYRRVPTCASNYAGVLSSLGNTLRAMGQFGDALAAHERALVAAPSDSEFHFNYAATLLATGDFAQGWEQYEWRWQRAQSRPRGFGQAWCGEPISGRTILLYAEQGLGDTLQFVRYAPMVAERGARVVLEVQPPLVRLMRGVAGVSHVVARGDALPLFDTSCPLLSLPRAFATRLGTIPAACPYLHVDPAAAAAWQAKLPADGGLRVGLVWAGCPHTDHAGMHLIDHRRSLGLAELAPLAGIAGVHLISLQKDRPDVAGMAPCAMTLIDLMPEIADFADTAALVANLDLVISVDTSVAHLAGALGRPVWLLSRYDGCWRWLHGRDDSPWYPGMRIYRQERPHDWSGVVARIRSDLVAFARQGPAAGEPTPTRRPETAAPTRSSVPRAAPGHRGTAPPRSAPSLAVHPTAAPSARRSQAGASD
jgi:tetratricopeptide (TPR) repeat protein